MLARRGLMGGGRVYPELIVYDEFNRSGTNLQGSSPDLINLPGFKWYDMGFFASSIVVGPGFCSSGVQDEPEMCTLNTYDNDVEIELSVTFMSALSNGELRLGCRVVNPTLGVYPDCAQAVFNPLTKVINMIERVNSVNGSATTGTGGVITVGTPYIIKMAVLGNIFRAKFGSGAVVQSTIFTLLTQTGVYIRPYLSISSRDQRINHYKITRINAFSF